MKKHILDAEALRVESFATAAGGGSGTVLAHQVGTSLDTCGDILTCAGGCDTRSGALGTGRVG